jgi:hypothetical protein
MGGADMNNFAEILKSLPSRSQFIWACGATGHGSSRCNAPTYRRQISSHRHIGNRGMERRATIVRLAFLALLVVSLGACGVAQPIARPIYSDPLANISNARSGTFRTDAPVKKAEPFGFILSDNVERFVDYIARNDADLLSYGPLSNTVALRDSNPRFLADLVVSQLKSRYTDIELVNDLNDALQKQKKSVAVIDIQVQLGNGSGDTTVVEIGLLFFDENFQPASKISARGAATIGYPAFSPRFRDAAEQASNELVKKLDALLIK